MHHGKCVARCPPQQHMDKHSRCRGRAVFSVSVLLVFQLFPMLSETSMWVLSPVLSAACHSSCASCWGPAVSQCSSCASGLLLHQGQCVEACGQGLYSLDDACHSKPPRLESSARKEGRIPSPLVSLPFLQTATPLAAHAWVLWLQTASSASNRRRSSCRSPLSSTASARPRVPSPPSWTTSRRAEVSRGRCDWSN